MKPTNSSQPIGLDEGRKLARELYDRDLGRLEDLSDTERDRLMERFPQLSRAQFEDVLRQVIAAKRQERARVGWQSIPHDVAAIVMVFATVLADLRTGLVAGVGVLVLLEGLFMAVFDEDLYRPLSLLVWLTYPAYALLGYVLYRRGYQVLEIAGAVFFAWPGMFLLGTLARVPLHLLWKERAKQRESR
ncbi:MAG: hypothetical protein PVJ55_06285 [Anaerolineae bacterium]